MQIVQIPPRQTRSKYLESTYATQANMRVRARLYRSQPENDDLDPADHIDQGSIYPNRARSPKWDLICPEVKKYWIIHHICHCVAFFLVSERSGRTLHFVHVLLLAANCAALQRVATAHQVGRRPLHAKELREKLPQHRQRPSPAPCPRQNACPSATDALRRPTVATVGPLEGVMQERHRL